MATFGEVISTRRKQLNLSQREVAARVRKEDGEPISPQYLNDLEHDRRNPPSPPIIDQLAFVLEVSPDVLYHCAGSLPPDIRCVEASETQVVAAFRAFRRTLKKKDNDPSS